MLQEVEAAVANLTTASPGGRSVGEWLGHADVIRLLTLSIAQAPYAMLASTSTVLISRKKNGSSGQVCSCML